MPVRSIERNFAAALAVAMASGARSEGFDEIAAWFESLARTERSRQSLPGLERLS
jgi:rubrerythrin